jgi:hypothetical protein
VNRVDVCLACDANDVLDVEVGLDRPLALADEVSLVCLGPVQREAVLLGIDRHRPHAQLSGSTHDADGDLAAIGNQQGANGSDHVDQAPGVGDVSQRSRIIAE